MSQRHIGIAITLCASFLSANPSGPDVVHGQADVQSLQNLLQITTSDKAIINWKEFSSAAGETIQFVQPSSSSAVLNRVTGGNTSTLYGDLQAGGQVYLVNPNGIVIGQHARIDAGAFTASTFDVLDSDFIEGSALRFFGDSKAGIINLGTIKTSAGDCSLISFQVESDGTIEAAGKVSLIASNKVILKPHDSQRIFIAADADVASGDTIDNPYLLAFNQTIEKDALHFKKNDTGVFLMVDEPVATVAGSIKAESVTVLSDFVQVLEGARIDVSSENGDGQILLGGDYQGKNDTLVNARQTYVAQGAYLEANALERGNGGKIIVWSNEATHHYGLASAQGGFLGGDGGFVEVSSPGSLVYQGRTNTTAPLGKTGTLLLDPSTIIIDTFGGLGSSVPALPTPTATYNPAVAAASIAVADLNNDLNALGGSSIIISTSAGAGGTGDIEVRQLVTWGAVANRTLTMNADRDIIIAPAGFPAGEILSTGVGCDIFLNAARHIQVNGSVQNTGVSPGATVQLIASSGNIDLPFTAPSTVPTRVANHFGPILVRATQGNITLTAGTAAAAVSSIGSATVAPSVGTTSSGSVTVEAGGNITINGSANTRAVIGRGNTPGINTIIGDITVNAVGDITLNTGSGAGCHAAIGYEYHSGAIRTITGDIRVNALGDVTLRSSPFNIARAVIGSDHVAGIPTTMQSNLRVNVGGNVLIEGQAASSTFAYFGYSVTSGVSQVATSIHIFVAGSFWMDGRMAICNIFPAYSDIPTNPNYPPQCFLHVLGNVTLFGGSVAGSNIPQISHGFVVANKTDFATHVWAGASPQNVSDPTGGVRCLSGPFAVASLWGFGSAARNMSVRTKGDYTESWGSNTVTGTGTAGPYSTFNPQFSGAFIETDACFAAGELWPAQAATVNGVNIFSSSPLGAASPAISCNGIGAFLNDSSAYNLNTAPIPTPYNGTQVSLAGFVAAPAVTGRIYASTSGDVIIRSADTILGEVFRGSIVVPGPNPSFTAGAPADMTFGGVANGSVLSTTSGNLEVSGCGPTIGPAPSTHSCPCGDSYRNIIVNAGGIAATPGHIYVSANQDLTLPSVGGGTLTTTGPSATSFITAVADNNNSGTGILTIAQNITTQGGPILLSSGFGAGSGTSSINQTAAQVNSNGGNITAQALGTLTVNGAATSFTSGAGSQLLESKTANVVINKIVTSTTGNITAQADAADVNLLGAGSLIQSSGGAIVLQAANDVNVNGAAVNSVTNTAGSILIAAGHDANFLQGANTISGPLSVNAGNNIQLNSGANPGLSSTSGPVQTNAGNDTNATSNVVTGGSITMLSGHSMFLLSATTNITSSGSSVDLVVDNDFPSPPGFGPGFFSAVAGSQVNSGGGNNLRIFTSQQGLNTIDPAALFNGVSVTAFGVPGTIFNNTAYEQWCTYYPSPFGGTPFTLFYKDCEQIIVQTGNRVVSDMLFNLNVENMWVEELLSPLVPPEVWRFMVIYGPGVNSLKHFAHERYWLSRRNIHFIHYPYVYKENKPPAELVPVEAVTKILQSKKRRV